MVAIRRIVSIRPPVFLSLVARKGVCKMMKKKKKIHTLSVAVKVAIGLRPSDVCWLSNMWPDFEISAGYDELSHTVSLAYIELLHVTGDKAIEHLRIGNVCYIHRAKW